MYCGVIMSRNSVAGRQAEIVDGRQHVARHPQALVDVEAAVEIGIVDQALPADGGARLLEIDPHHDLELVGQVLAQRSPGARRSRARPRDRGSSRGRPRPAGGRRWPSRMAWMALRDACTTRVAVSVRGISRITSSGVLSSFSSRIRRSSVVLSTAGLLLVSETCRPNKKAARSGGLFGSFAAIFRSSAILPPPASCRS